MFTSKKRTLRKALGRFLNINAQQAQFNVRNQQGDVLFQIHRSVDTKRWEIPIDFGEDDGYVLEFYLETKFIERDEALSKLKFFDYYDSFKSYPELGFHSVFFYLNSKSSAKDILKLTGEIVSHVHGEMEFINYEFFAH